MSGFSSRGSSAASGNKPSRVTVFGDLVVGERRSAMNAAFDHNEISDSIVRLHQNSDLTSVSGTFTDNEIVYGGTSGAEGWIIVAGAVATITVRAGRFTNGETVTGFTSGASATITANNHARASQTGGFLICSTKTETDTVLHCESARPSPYVTGSEFVALFTAIWPEGSASGTQLLAGIGNAENRLQIGYNGTGWGLYYLNGHTGSPIFIPQASLDDPLDGTGASGIVFDPTKINVWRISFGYLGAAGMELSILRQDATWQCVHLLERANLITSPIFSTPDANLRFSAIKSSGNASEYTVRCASWSVGSIGPQTGGVVYHTTGALVASTGAGAEKAIVAIEQLRFHHGETQYRNASVREMTIAVEGNKPSIIRVRKNSRITGGSWADIDQYNSHIQSNTTMTSFSPGQLEQVITLKKEDSAIIALDKLNFLLQPGETLLVTAESSSTTSALIYLQLAEPLS